MLRDRNVVPTNCYGSTRSALNSEALSNDLALYLQSRGKYICAQDVVDYLVLPEGRRHHGLKKGVKLRAATEWLKRMGYCWRKTPRGQYVDGHERVDVVFYRQNVFLPAMSSIEHRTRAWILTHLNYLGPLPPNRLVVIWFHDESTFYANDRREVVWSHKDAKATPHAKGEGPSFMIADFVSADYGWLRAQTTDENARVYFKAGEVFIHSYLFVFVNHFLRTTRAMDILAHDYSDEEHWFVFDNATTHRKRHDDALSARRMPKNPSPYPKLANDPDTNFGIHRSLLGPDGKVVYETKTVQPHRKKGTLKTDPVPEKKQRRVPKTTWLPMQDTNFTKTLPDVSLSSSRHFTSSSSGHFKGMSTILQERGFLKVEDLKAECSGFNCPPGEISCCCRRLLYSQPDFMNVNSGFHVLFLPKFHSAKRFYRMLPASSKEEYLELNVKAALESVSLTTMRQ
ncbi:hypothetical protein BDP27DRAFT_1384717 [Rhodocollybia butyracea]|uniref:Uncharacterized protein n=1 Tax=Rhodocollybia butyracea TaxID=206335 RepID=A0A9P5PLG8_9AGAR|nr:hypothetical protein BDP27DRAFT_1384717 [Rhodocollybia butyracea]